MLLYEERRWDSISINHYWEKQKLLSFDWWKRIISDELIRWRERTDSWCGLFTNFISERVIQKFNDVENKKRKEDCSDPIELPKKKKFLSWLKHIYQNNKKLSDVWNFLQKNKSF